MAHYNSLLQYLDKQLPGSFRINLRNFFSFLPFVTPVDIQVAALRILVDKAKKMGNHTDYVDYYQDHALYFKSIFSKKDSYNNSDNENPVSELIEQSSTTSITNSLKSQTENSKEEEVVTEKKPDYLSQVQRIAHTANWQEQLTNLLNTLDESQRIDLAKELIDQDINPNDENLINCTIKTVECLNFDIAELKKRLFNNLQNAKDILNYERYLTMLGDMHNGQLLKLIDKLESKFRLGRDFFQVKHALRPLRDGSPIHKHSETLNTIERLFQEWQKNQSSLVKQNEEIVKQVSACLSKLKVIITEFVINPKLKEKITKDSIAEIEDFRKAQDVEDFNKKLALGQIPFVTFQRLRELFPKEESYQQKINQCYTLGIQVFDATDDEAMKNLGFS